MAEIFMASYTTPWDTISTFDESPLERASRLVW
jgi:hypothetical protein